MKARQRARAGVCRFPVWQRDKPARAHGARQGGAFVIAKNNENAAPACAGFHPPTNHPIYNTRAGTSLKPQNPEDSAAFTVEESSGGEGGIKEKKPTGPLRRGHVMGFSIGSPKNMPAQILTAIRNLSLARSGVDTSWNFLLGLRKTCQPEF